MIIETIWELLQAVAMVYTIWQLRQFRAYILCMKDSMGDRLELMNTVLDKYDDKSFNETLQSVVDKVNEAMGATLKVHWDAIIRIQEELNEAVLRGAQEEPKAE